MRNLSPRFNEAGSSKAAIAKIEKANTKTHSQNRSNSGSRSY